MTLKPRGLVLDLFGAYLRHVGAEVRLAHLTTLLERFEIAPATVRVTMSRLRREGWFESRREGRETVYTLSQAMLTVLDEGHRAIFAPAAREWTGSWTMVLYQLSEGERLERDQLRKQLAWHGFGPLTTSTWMAPGERRAEVHAFLSDHQRRQVDVLSCTTAGPAEDRDLVQRCWDLDTLARDYQAFLSAHGELPTRAARLSPAEALVARTHLIATFRGFPFRDPRLPVELQPDSWPGAEAHALFEEAYGLLGPAAREYVGGVVGQPIVEEGSTARS